jgi:hypothetical protein
MKGEKERTQSSRKSSRGSSLINIDDCDFILNKNQDEEYCLDSPKFSDYENFDSEDPELNLRVRSHSCNLFNREKLLVPKLK